jgi:hypothetical protein
MRTTGSEYCQNEYLPPQPPPKKKAPQKTKKMSNTEIEKKPEVKPDTCESKTISIYYKKRLKIPKGYSESVNQGGIDNTMVKRKSTKGTSNELQNITHQTKDRVT